MRQISRLDFAVFVMCFSVCFASISQAQQSSKIGQRPVQSKVSARPNDQTAKAPAANDNGAKEGSATGRRMAPVEETADDEMPPELIAILKHWEVASAKVKTLHGMQSRSEFIKAFSVEKVTKGHFFLETPDKGRIDMLACEIKKGEVSKKKDKDGSPYTLESGQSMKWICTGEAILQLSENENEIGKEKEKTYQKVEIPEDQRGANIVHTPLPFLFGMKAEEAKTRFRLKLQAENADFAKIWVFPRMEKDRQNYTAAAITLDKKRYLPTRVHLVDEDTGVDVVYTFESIVVNERKLLPNWGSDPYHPNLRGYKLVVANDDPVEVPLIRPASGQAPRRLGTDTSPLTLPRRSTSSSATAPGAGATRRN